MFSYINALLSAGPENRMTGWIASNQRSIVIFSGSQKSMVIFLNLTTLIKDADQSTATTSVPPFWNGMKRLSLCANSLYSTMYPVEY